jgi:hypothetical protein
MKSTTGNPLLVKERVYPSIRDPIFISRCVFHFEMRFSFRDALFVSKCAFQLRSDKYRPREVSALAAVE